MEAIETSAKLAALMHYPIRGSVALLPFCSTCVEGRTALPPPRGVGSMAEGRLQSALKCKAATKMQELAVQMRKTWLPAVFVEWRQAV